MDIENQSRIAKGFNKTIYPPRYWKAYYHTSSKFYVNLWFWGSLANCKVGNYVGGQQNRVAVDIVEKKFVEVLELLGLETVKKGSAGKVLLGHICRIVGMQAHATRT